MVLLNISVNQKKLGSQSFSRSLFLMKSDGDKVINGKEGKGIDELLFFPTFHFHFFLGVCPLDNAQNKIGLTFTALFLLCPEIIHLVSNNLTEMT